MKFGWKLMMRIALLRLFVWLRMLNCRKPWVLNLVASGFLLLANHANAYEVDGSKWFRAKATFYVSIPGLSATNISWNTATIEALNQWSDSTLFDFTVVEENKDPCSDDGFSSIDFTEDVCGSEFGTNTLAVALLYYEAQELGPPNIIEGNIVVNDAARYNIFDGPLVQPGLVGNAVDFKRVVLHELGHVIGLGHEETVPAIMAPTVSDVFELQEDDIAGVEALYSGLSKCEIKILAVGSSKEQLDANDCTVSELTAGGTDDSFIDLYRFDVDQTTAFDFSVSAQSLDAVLLLATTELHYLAVDSSSTQDCNSTLNRSLEPGSYLLMVNTYDQPIKTDCGVSGDYVLTANFSTEAQLQLGMPASLLGSFSQASFIGGISADDGASFGNVFSPWDSLDITAEITVDPVHVGEMGFLLVAALLPDQLLMLNEQNQFVDVSVSGSPLAIYRRKLLAETEHIDIVNNLVPGTLGIFQLEANFVVGYGLEANPDEAYYHTTPMNLIVETQADDGS